MINNRSDAMKFLLEFTDYEKVAKYKYDIATFSLARVEQLMQAVGAPHRALRAIHVAGTKGKGSTSVFAQGMLTAAGLRTGLYTSPHLTLLEERMTVDGRMMSEGELVALIAELVPYTEAARQENPNESPTFFELVTAAGFRHFVKAGVQAAVVEVGMGGRLDATNVITPAVSVITRIDYDHVEKLGHTLDKIAFEKAGIIKPGVPVVSAPQHPEAMGVIERVAAERGCALTVIGREYRVENVRTGLDGGAAPFCRLDLTGPDARWPGLELGMLGPHQALNAAAALAATRIAAAQWKVPLPEQAIRDGLRAARIPARLEVIPGRPLILLDGAHNPASIEALCRTIEAVFPARRFTLLMGVSRDKNAAEMFQMILPCAEHVIFTRSDSPRAEEPEALAALAAAEFGVVAESHQDARAALDRARALAGPGGLLVITGSFFLAGLLRPGLLAANGDEVA